MDLVVGGETRAAVFVVSAFATIFCTAVNCYTLRIAYPLWRFVGAADFPGLHREYLRRLGPVITFPHIVMFFANLALLRWRPQFFSFADAASMAAAGVFVVAISAFRAGPIHTRFTRTGILDAAGLRQLLQISFVRSVVMMAASGLICWQIAQALGRT